MPDWCRGYFSYPPGQGVGCELDRGHGGECEFDVPVWLVCEKEWHGLDAIVYCGRPLSETLYPIARQLGLLNSPVRLRMRTLPPLSIGEF